MECNKMQNKQSCACRNSSCERNGQCCLCVRHHRARGEFPACFFSEAALDKGGRGYDLLVEDRS